MAPVSAKKRKLEDGVRGKTSRPKKKFRKQRDYHSSSEDSEQDDGVDFKAVSLAEDLDTDAVLPAMTKTALRNANPPSSSEDEITGDEEDGPSQDEFDEGDLDSLAGSKHAKSRSKRNDPNAFSTSISKILSTKLSQSARQDPVLSRSREAVQTSNDVANEKLESRARAKLRAEKREALDKGRVRDVLGLDSGEAGQTAEEEKRLRKIAQKGVIKLFNAVRAAQVKGEEAAREERKKGTVGLVNRESKVNDVSKQGFLDLINGKSRTNPIEEA